MTRLNISNEHPGTVGETFRLGGGGGGGGHFFLLTLYDFKNIGGAHAPLGPPAPRSLTSQVQLMDGRKNC